MRFLAYLSVLLLLSSCSISNRLVYSDRAIHKEAIRRGLIIKDTVMVTSRDTTIVTDSFRVDSLVRVDVRDTVTLIKDRLSVRVVRVSPDSLAIMALVKPDTITVVKYITKRESITQAPTIDWGLPWKWIVALCVLALLLGAYLYHVLFGYLLRRIPLLP